MGKSTISMAMFNSYVKLPEGSPVMNHPTHQPFRASFYINHPKNIPGHSGCIMVMASVCHMSCLQKNVQNLMSLHSLPIGSMVQLYMVTFTINIPQMLAYIPYMDPMGYRNSANKLPEVTIFCIYFTDVKILANHGGQT